MKYCSKCGAEIVDEAVVCPKCGCMVENRQAVVAEEMPGIRTAAKIFMILGCVLMGMWLIPLCWTLPMTLSYCGKIKTHRHVSTGFKICCLLFVSLVGGVLMLCDDNPD